MLKYITKRLLMLIPVVLGVAILIFTFMHMVPGDVATIIMGQQATQQEIEAKREDLGLNDPFVEQLGRFLHQIFIEFDLGKSLLTNVSIKGELATRFPRTMILAFTSTALSLLVGVSLGSYAALHQSKPGDYLTMGVALLGISMPNFWLAIMMVIFFSLNLGILPSSGLGGFEHWIMPCVAASFMGISTQARFARTSMLEVIGADYITMARSKGIRERAVILKHALPNALIPTITVAGSTFGSQLSGSLIIENVFAIPGVGAFLVQQGVNNRDYNIVRSCVVVLSIVFSIVIILTDVLLATVDPRIKAQFASDRKSKKKG